MSSSDTGSAGWSFAAEGRAFAAAFTFMTRIPLWRWIAHDLSDLPRSATWFPLVGAVVGAVGAIVFLLADQWWSSLIAALLSTVATVRLTGAFHEDALADSLDGFGGGWTPEQVLTIMKDSRVGSYALVGMILAVVTKCVVLAEFSGAQAAAALIAAHTLGRCASVWLIAALPYVRPAESAERPSAGRPFVDGVHRGRIMAATIASAIVVTLCLGEVALPAITLALLLTAASGRYFRRRIGGITGDALGAVNQLVELGVYLMLAAAPVRGWLA
ncbi:MAG TPA: adenosylcobinamide-GDP ribazoletransferase [Gemmatimonas sp.]|uniref:adenosylcobinamide-GDP ribazoletransferase n=1 Tax=Gemmatimonas sp. TaxID=1962908 RepID=UPI002ED83A42